MKRMSLSVVFLSGAALALIAAAANAGPTVGGRSHGTANSFRAYYSPLVAEPAFFSYYTPAARSEGGQEEQEPLAPANVEIRVPQNAEVWFDGHRTAQTGVARSFITPPLERAKTYGYEVRVRWTAADGRSVEVTRNIYVKAGRQTLAGLGSE